MRDLFDSTIQRLFADLVTPELRHATQNGAWSAPLWSAIEQSGFSVAAANEESGGTGSSWYELYVVVRATGKYAVPAPLPEALLANWLLARAGLNAIATPLSFAAEPSLQLTSGKVSGLLQAVPWGRHVGHVVALTSGEHPSVVLLKVADATKQELQLNMAHEPRDNLHFTDAVPVALAALPAGLPADILLLGGAMLRSAQIAGALQAALAMTSTYATERSQFGRPIAGFQAIQHRLAVLAEHTASAMVASEAAFAESGDFLATLPVMAAKVCASEAAGIAAETAHAVHGAIGITEEYALHHITQRLWSWRSEFGTFTTWAQRIGRDVCAGGAQQFWPGLTANPSQHGNNGKGELS